MKKAVSTIIIFLIWISIAFPLAPIIFDNIRNVLNNSNFGVITLNYKQPKVITENNTTTIQYENGTIVYDFRPIIFLIIIILYYFLPIIFVIKKVI